MQAPLIGLHAEGSAVPVHLPGGEDSTPPGDVDREAQASSREPDREGAAGAALTAAGGGHGETAEVPGEDAAVTSWLELFYDLAFVAAIHTIARQLEQGELDRGVLLE